MRLKIVMAILATGILLYACDWFSSSTLKNKNFDITGTWLIDSIVVSTDGNDSTILAFHVDKILLDSLPGKLEFKNDTLIYTMSENLIDTGFYQFTDKTKQLKIDDELFSVIDKEDSSAVIISNASDSIFLRRQ